MLGVPEVTGRDGRSDRNRGWCETEEIRGWTVEEVTHLG